MSDRNKLFPVFLMLVAGAITMAVMLLTGYRRVEALWILLIILIVFYLIGSLIQKRIWKFEDINEEKAKEEAEKEGAVIEKEILSDGDSDDYIIPPLNGDMSGTSGAAETVNGDSSGFRRRPEDSGE